MPASTSRPSRTVSRPSWSAHRSGRFPSTSTWLTRSPCRDSENRSSGRDARACTTARGVEPVRGHPVVELELVPVHRQAALGSTGQVRVLRRLRHAAGHRVARPAGPGGDGVAAQHERRRSDAGAVVEARRGQHHAVRAQARAPSELHRVHAHDPIMEQMCLQHAPAVHGGRVAERHQVGLGQPVGLAPDPATDAGAERPQPHGERRRAVRGRSQPRHGDDLEERVRELVAPDERAPQRVVAGAQPADEQPLGRRRERRTRRAAAAEHDQRGERGGGPETPRVERGLQHQEDQRRRARTCRSRARSGTARRAREPPAAASAARTCAASSASPATRRSFTGGDPSQLTCRPARPRAWPTARRRARAWAPRGRARSSPSCRGTRACPPCCARPAASRAPARRSR